MKPAKSLKKNNIMLFVFGFVLPCFFITLLLDLFIFNQVSLEKFKSLKGVHYLMRRNIEKNMDKARRIAQSWTKNVDEIILNQQRHGHHFSMVSDILTSVYYFDFSGRLLHVYPEENSLIQREIPLNEIFDFIKSREKNLLLPSILLTDQKHPQALLINETEKGIIGFFFDMNPLVLDFTYLKNDIVLTLVDQSGRIILTNDENPHTQILDSHIYTYYKTRYTGEILQEKRRTGNQNYYDFVDFLKISNWCLITSYSENALFQPINSMLIILLLFFLIIIILGVLIYQKIFKAFNRDVSNFLHSVKQIANGDYTLKPYKGNYREIYELSQCIEDMADSIKEREQNLRASEIKFRSLFESAPLGIAMGTPEGQILMVNQAFEKMLGYSTQELEGLYFHDITHPDEADTNNEHFRQLLEGKISSFTVDKRYINHDNQSFWGTLSVSMLKDHSQKPHMIIALMENITEKMEMTNRLKKSLNEKEILLQEIHHRVKNNLQIISSLVGLQLSTLKTPESEGILLDIKNRIHSLSLLHQMLYESGDFEQVDLCEYLQKLTSYLTLTYNSKQCNIKCNVDIKNIQLDLIKAIPCGLLLNEILSNSGCPTT